MAAIKALEGRTVHQIQSGQVIVDLCSVVKELVENSLDAGASSIEVRFKNHGLESIEVQDNGIGISCENYETIALKHYTSKLSSYDELSSLQTFGFRGEALSSLCALSKFHVITARADEAPKGTRLNFEISGMLADTQVVASQKGTTVAVQDLFRNLPVRRRELEKNIKREYGKALGLLQAYACISTQARISVSNMLVKGKKMVAFATRSNSSTRENIANVFGVKLLPGLISLNLSFEMRPRDTHSQLCEPSHKQVRVLGHVSRPTLGEGRQAPDRQLFFVNTRPCALPQIAKVFNEVYKIHNVSQSPFVFADIILDTNAYDASLIELFEKQDQSVPISQKPNQKLPSFKQLTVRREESVTSEASSPTVEAPVCEGDGGVQDGDSSIAADIDQDVLPQADIGTSLIENFVGRDSKDRINNLVTAPVTDSGARALSRDKLKLVKKLSAEYDQPDESASDSELPESGSDLRGPSIPVNDFNERIAEQRPASLYDESKEELSAGQGQRSPSTSSIVQDAFDCARPRRHIPEVATITIGSKTTTSLIGSSSSKALSRDTEATAIVIPRHNGEDVPNDKFSSSIRSFAAPGSELTKTVGKPQSKWRVSTNWPHHQDDNRESMTDSSSLSQGSDDEASAQEDQSEAHTLEPIPDKPYQISSSPNARFDELYHDEDENRAWEEAKVAELLVRAEKVAGGPSQDNKKRALQLLKGSGQKDSTIQLVQAINTSLEEIDRQICALTKAVRQSPYAEHTPTSAASGMNEDTSPEDRLSLTVSKTDFIDMHVSGQFNLGFILATRENADLFIIDQHASDEKYNFECLQSTTIVQSQRLVQPRVLQLTAVDEEIILEHKDALLKNGFLIEVDTSGSSAVGQRCKLLSLPMSRSVTFDIDDLEELIALLADFSVTSGGENVPRPSKVRRMFAMRACRSSIMVGKTLTFKQMEALVRKMGEIDKPWNCPHGRPTMRHVQELDGWETWSEGDGLVGLEEDVRGPNWRSWFTKMSGIKFKGSEEDQAEEGGSECGEREEDHDEDNVSSESDE